MDQDLNELGDQRMLQSIEATGKLSLEESVTPLREKAPLMIGAESMDQKTMSVSWQWKCQSDGGSPLNALVTLFKKGSVNRR